MKNIKKYIIILLVIVSLIIIGTNNTQAADNLSGKHTSGSTITITQAGKYYFQVAGAQGGDYKSYTGGKGGITGFEIELEVGDKVQLVVDKNGGTGNASNGGGYSAVYINNTLVTVAGGGGGATSAANGGHGGITGSGNNGQSLAGSSSSLVSRPEVSHVHSGSATSGGDCYKTKVYHAHNSSCNCPGISKLISIDQYYNGTQWYDSFTYQCAYCGKQEGFNWTNPSGNGYLQYCVGESYTCGKTTSTIERYALSCTKTSSIGNGLVDGAGGGAGYQGGTAGYYHAHTGGTAASAGGSGTCYTNPVYHTHSAYGGACYSPVYHSHSSSKGCEYTEGWGCDGCIVCLTNGCVDLCGGSCGPYYYWSCGKSGSTIDSYTLSCTKSTTSPISWTFSCPETVGNTVSKGGSNYINTSLNILNYFSYGESTIDGVDYKGNTGSAYIDIIKEQTIQADVNKPASANYDVEINEELLTIKLLNGTNLPEYLPTPELYGYEFLGWYDSSAGGTKLEALDLFDTSTKSTIYAQWKPLEVNIGLSVNSEYANSLSEDIITRNYGEAFDLPIPTNPFEDFLGWYTSEIGGTQVNSNDLIHYTKPATEDDNNYLDVTYYLFAHWSKSNISVTFDATTNGGTISGSSNTTVYNGSCISSFPTASKSNSTFIGWFTSPDGGEQYNTSTEVWVDNSVGSITLYARFEASNSTIFPYTGSVQTYTIPQNGFYRLEAYGAQGGDSNGYSGGKGGYTAGVKYFTAGEVLKVYVGGKASTFNGGGTAQAGFGAGGGATDFRYGGTALTNRILVSGGGGGATKAAHGYPGGGTSNAGNNGTSGTGSSGQIGGGGGYVGGAAGQFVQHFCSSPNTPNCYVQVTKYKTEWQGCSGTVRYVGNGNVQNGVIICTFGCSEGNLKPHHQCNKCGGGWHMGNPGPCPNGRSVTVSYKVWEKRCGYYNGQILTNIPGSGGSNYVDSGMYLQKNQAGVQGGNGLAKITLMYTVVLDTNKPLESNNFTANATNIPFIDIVDTVLKEEALPYTEPNYTRFESTGQSGRQTWALLITERNTTYGTNDKLPVPSLKGWKFTGWYTEPQLDKGVQVTDASSTRINNTTKQIDNHILYAHWEPEVYYIKYYMNNTNKNVYGDTYTNPTAAFDTTLTGAVKNTNTDYTYNSTEDCYIQTVKYDHDIKILPNYYAKTGYYFKNWTNKADTNLTGLEGTKSTGTGTGKQTGTTYYESAVITQHKDGETFKANYGNFNYIINEKALALGTEITPVWKYGNQTVVLYATWEPIKYRLRFNGTDNWNENSAFSTGTYTNQDSYLQNVTNASGNTDTTIRYDQIFRLDNNLFTRNAPYTITSKDGLPVVLKSGYGHLGWGFGKNTMKYDSSISYKLLSMNTEYNPEQALNTDSDTVGRNYSEAQTNVKNVISTSGIQKITKYISDWSNDRNDNNRRDKTTLESNVIESNLHSIWRRNSNDDHNNNGGSSNCPEDCPCPDDGNGNCTCPSDDCIDTDDDGTCDCHDPEPNNPNEPSGGSNPSCPEGCDCPEDITGDCDCPSDDCLDNDGDHICDCHDPDPGDSNNPNEDGDDNDDGDPTDGNDTDNFGITLTFDLNGGYINIGSNFYYEPIVLKQELFNSYYYKFNIIGNENKDHLNHIEMFDAYGKYSNTANPEKNYNSGTGLNIIFGKGDGNGGMYRLSGWSTNKGAIYPDYEVTIDGILNNNLDTFDSSGNNDILEICNDTTLYAVWEPVPQLNVEVSNIITGDKVKTGTLTTANQSEKQNSGLPTLSVKPGQEVSYLIAIRGENNGTIGSKQELMEVQVEFDQLITGIYEYKNNILQDNLNIIKAEDLDDPNETMLLSSSNLNRKLVKQKDETLIRKFSVPAYLGTQRAKDLGYDSFKEDGYEMIVKLTRYSNFFKGYETVTAKLILDTSGSSGSGGSGGSGGGSGDSGDSGNSGNLPNSIIGEFRTNIKMVE